MNFKYVEITFENADAKVTEQIMLDLEDEGIGYEHITGQTGNLIGCVMAEINWPVFKDQAENIVYAHNGGAMVEVEERTYEQVEQFL